VNGLKRFFFGQDGEQGQAVVLIAITTLAMLMIVGLAIDAGQLYAARRTMQEAADAAAYAGAIVLYQNHGNEATVQGQAFSAARTDGTLNGFTHAINGVTVIVQQPTQVPYNSDKYVEVIMSQNVRTVLVPAQAGLTFVQVRAIAGSDPSNNNYAIMALDRAATPCAFQDRPTATVTLSGGGVLVNSTAAASANCPGGGGGNGAAMNQTAAWTIDCTGNPCSIDIAGGGAGTWPPVTNPPNPGYAGTNMNAPQQPDPFAGTPKPTNAASTLLTNPAYFGPSNGTARQGVYTSELNGKKLCHGYYLLKDGMGGDLDIDTSTADPDRPGQNCDGRVFIFNTLSTFGTASYPASGSCGSVNIAGNHDVTLLPLLPVAAPGFEQYAGMLLFQDPICTQDVNLSGTSLNFNVGGTIYVPSALFRADGHTSVTGGQIVAKTVDLGNSIINISFNPANSAQPILPRLTK